MKYYNYIPIVKSDNVPAIVNVGADAGLSKERHDNRLKDALTDFICELSCVANSTSVRELFLKYNISLIENVMDGSRTISSGFPEKRFY